jgi:hypothetical protein
VGEIQQCLAVHGAKVVLHEYDDRGNVVALSFRITVGNKDVAFGLPSD